MATQRIKINPNLLKWARKTAHLKISDVPKSLISHEKLENIELGKIQPTFVQLQKLARKYDRPLFILMGEKIPKEDYQELPFFRKENKTDYNSPLALFIRDIQKKQEWAKNYLLEDGFPELDFIGSVQLNNNHKLVAQKIINRMSLPSFENFNYTQREDFFKVIKKKLEEKNVFVSITGSDKSNRAIDLNEAQGFAIPDDIAPFVFINTKSTINAKIFTIIHELVHLFLNETGISEDVIKFRKIECYEDKIENFCNKVTAEILMPEKIFLKYYKKTKGDLFQKIEQCSKFFLVSELAVFVRIFQLDLIDLVTFNSTFADIKGRIDFWIKEDIQKKKEAKGGGNYYASMLSKNGFLLSKLAFYAHKEGQFMATDISKLLNIKINNFDNYFEKI
jgi:Zn-dependent peptidase ImmA (M78 family)